MNLFPEYQSLAATAPVWSAPLVGLVAGLWVWWVRHGMDRSQKVHCRDCDYRGHPRVRAFPVRGVVCICPDCAGEALVPVLPRGWLHHQEGSPLAVALQKAARRRQTESQPVSP